MKQKALFILLVLVILNIVSVTGYSLYKYIAQKKIAQQKDAQSFVFIDASLILKATSTVYTQEQKIEAVKALKELSYDESASKELRLVAGEQVVNTFFNHGVTLSKGFTTASTSQEREIYEYAKYLNTLGDSERNSLLAAYIGLRFYDTEETQESIKNLLLSHKRYVEKNGASNPCGNGSKFASVIYLSQKSKHADVSEEFGDYYSNFERTIDMYCTSTSSKIVPSFMWLAAITDIGSTEKENKKANELVRFITSDVSENSPLVRNLRSSYFSEQKEPDTVSIVERLLSMSAMFSDFIKNIKP
jgi:hypothetical protein